MLSDTPPVLLVLHHPPSPTFASKLSTRLPLRSSISSMAQNESPPPLPPPRRVVVCGGGVIGVCTAFFLARKGARVTLIEKSSVACAASGKAAGFLALDWCEGGPLSDLARASFNLHRTLALELDGPQAYGYRPLHTLSLTFTEGFERSHHSSLPAWIDGPAQNPKTIGTPETTAQVHPQLFTRKLLSAAVAEHGVEVVVGEVERVVVEEGRAKAVVVKEGEGVIEADDVVLALGPWSCRLPMLASLFRVSGLKAHSVVFQPREPSAITPHALVLSYYPDHGGRPMDPEVHPRPTGEVYVCGMSSEAQVPDDPEEIVGDVESIKVLKRVAGTVSSQLKEGEVQVKAEQACFLPCTDDNKPVIGEHPNVRRCFVATGHSGWGILNGPATGAAMAELVLEGQSSIVDLTPFSPARFVSGTRRTY